MAAATDEDGWLPPIEAERREYYSSTVAARARVADFRRRAERRAPVFLALWTSGRREEAMARYRDLAPPDRCSAACRWLSLELLRRTGDDELAEALLQSHERRPPWGTQALAEAARSGRVALFQRLMRRLRGVYFHGTSLAESVVVAPAADDFDFVGPMLAVRDGPAAVARAAAGLNRRDVFERAFRALAPHGGELPCGVARCVVSQGWLDVLEDGGFRFNPLALSSTSSTAVLDRMLASPVLRPMLLERVRGVSALDALASRKRRRGQQLTAHLLAALTPAELRHVSSAPRIAETLFMTSCPRPAAAALMLDAGLQRATADVARVAVLALINRPLPSYAFETFRVLMSHDSVLPVSVPVLLDVARRKPPELGESWMQRWHVRRATALKAALSLQRCGRVTAAERAELVEAVGPELAPLARSFGAWARRGPLLLVRALVHQGRATALPGLESAEGFVVRAPGGVVRAVASFL